MMPRLSLRGLFSLLYLSSVIPLLLLLGSLVYYEYRVFLINERITTMQELVDTAVTPHTPEDLPGIPLPLPRLGDLLVEQMQGTDFAVVVLDADGQSLAQSAGAEGWLTAAQQAAMTQSPFERTQTIATPEGERALYLLPVQNPNGQVVGTIGASFAKAVVLDEIQLLVFWLLITVGGVVVLALIVTPLLSRMAARPVVGLVRTARQVARGNLDTRAPLPPVSELHTLAVTFNTMLDQVQHTVAIEQQTATTLRRFVADAAHELRSPLAVLRGSMDVWQVAQQRGDEDEAQQATALIQAEIDGMDRLVDNLLLLARMDNAIDQPQTPLHHTDVEPLPLLEEVVERARLLARGQDIGLVWPHDELPPLRADADLLRRALNNLIENALRYTSPGKHITLSVAPEHNGCAFVVRDEGIGIAPEHLQRLFERFYQVNDARTRRGSSGLGLAIVQAIAQAHGGTVRVESTVGHGTTVTIWLPTLEPQFQARRASLPELLAHKAAQIESYVHRPRPEPERRGRWRTGVAIAVSGLLLLFLVGNGPVMLPTLDDHTPDALSSVVVIAETPALTATTAPPAAAAPVDPSQPAGSPGLTAPVPLVDGIGFDAAAQQAVAHLGGGTPLEVVHVFEEGATIYEVVFSDRTEVYLDLGSGTVLDVERVAGSDGRGAEQLQITATRLASAVAQGATDITFDEAVTAAQAAAAEYDSVREVELEWSDDQERVVYSVEFVGGPELLIDPQTGDVLDWEE